MSEQLPNILRRNKAYEAWLAGNQAESPPERVLYYNEHFGVTALMDRVSRWNYAVGVFPHEAPLAAQRNLAKLGHSRLMGVLLVAQTIAGRIAESSAGDEPSIRIDTESVGYPYALTGLRDPDEPSSASAPSEAVMALQYARLTLPLATIKRLDLQLGALDAVEPMIDPQGLDSSLPGHIAIGRIRADFLDD